MLGYLIASFGYGLAALLTPCVFPMIPVTVSYFIKRKEGSALAGAATYALGIVSTFAVIGIATALLFGATGLSNFAANPWVNLSLGILFVALALNLFGLYEIGVPAALTSKMSKASSGKNGFVGPVLMGATFSLTSFTCTMPFVASTLASAAKGSFLYPAIGMATYGVAFSLPFFLLALFPSALAKMPKSGDWLNAVKPVLGYIELAAAVKFFSNADLGWSAGILTKPVFLALWAVVFALLGAYLFGLPEKIREVGWGRRILGAGSFWLCAFLMTGLNDRSLGELNGYLPPSPYPYIGKASDRHGSSSEALAAGSKGGAILAADYAEALATAKKTGRPVFIDFTGVNCTNCRWMEKNIFPKDEVQAQFNGFVKVQLYTDRPTDSDRANQALQTKLVGDNALPTYVLLTPEGKLIDKEAGLVRDVNEFVGFLKKANKGS